MTATAADERIARLWAGADGAQLDAQLVFSPENRRYLSGFSGSSGFLLVGRERDQRWLFTDFRYTEQAEAEAPGYEVVRHGREVFGQIGEVARRHGMTRIGVEAHKVTVEQLRAMREQAPDIEWRETAGVVERVRMVKSAEEIGHIRRAAAIAGEALTRVLADLAPGQTEEDVALALQCAMLRAGAERLAFDTIVASGPRGSLPHGHPTPKPLQAGELVTIDFGAFINGYNSDETVTVAIGGGDAAGRDWGRLRAMYDIVYAAQAAGIEAIRPGVRASEIDRIARAVITDGGYGPEFGHSTGHGVGLEVHELPYVATNPPVDYVLEAGMVITVEPGIYLPGVGGVRLEDTLAVTGDGCERLTGVAKAWRVV